MVSKKPTERFSNRVEDYVKYRPSYPKELFALLEQELHLPKTAEIADIGAGTGILSKLLCDEGYQFVYGIEPNSAMYRALQQYMQESPNFAARLASAENTSLASDSIDLITCGQSFHWFDVQAVQSEFHRILRHGGWVVLIWNTWRKDTPLGQAYEQILLDYAIDYKQVAHTEQSDARFDTLWGKNHWTHRQFHNSQNLDLEGLKGRFFSSSYTPVEGEEGHEAMEAAIEAMFRQFSQEGRVLLEYITDVYYGTLNSQSERAETR
jgi:SAM-dependent methyltransferase